MVWQLQDSWPAVSWSVVDFFGRRKLAWYAARRAMADHAFAVLAPDNDPDRLEVVRVGGTATDPLRLRAVDAEGRQLAEASVAPRPDAAAGAERVARVAAPAELVAAVRESGGLLLADAPTLGRRVWAPAPDRALAIPPARYRLDKLSTAGELVIRLTAETLLRDVVISPGPGPAWADAPADEQARTLLPGEAAVFRFPLPPGTDPATARPTLSTANALSGRGPMLHTPTRGPSPRPTR